jgi:hypothetical protein
MIRAIPAVIKHQSKPRENREAFYWREQSARSKEIYIAVFQYKLDGYVTFALCVLSRMANVGVLQTLKVGP